MLSYKLCMQFFFLTDPFYTRSGGKCINFKINFICEIAHQIIINFIKYIKNLIQKLEKKLFLKFKHSNFDRYVILVNLFGVQKTFKVF